MQVQNDVRAVTDEESIIDNDTVGLESLKFLEKCGDVDNSSRTDKVHTFLVDESETARDHVVV